MARLYGTVRGDAAKTEATRRGFEFIAASAQSYQGSVIVAFYMGEDDAEPSVCIDLAPGSTDTAEDATPLFRGSLSELRERATI